MSDYSSFGDWLIHNITAVVALVSAVIAFSAVLINAHLTRSKNAIDFWSAYHASAQQKESTKAMVEWVHGKPTPEQTRALGVLPFKDPILSTHIREILSTWERVSIAIRKKVYDEDLLFDAYGSSIVDLWINFRPFIEERRKANDRLYVHFLWLVKRWQVRIANDREQAAIRRKAQADSLIHDKNKIHTS
ncbi:hypothetical protein BurMR1_3699 [Burkholderia sp. MR1]|nr:hypothetical protein BurMR1_3699 [Burkholderia sp. MR1]